MGVAACTKGDEAGATAPLSPRDKRFDVIDKKANPVIKTNNIRAYVRFVENNVFLQGFKNGQDQLNQKPPVLLRGCLILEVLRPCKLSRIMLTFQGDLELRWPPDMKQNIDAYHEKKSLMTHHWVYFDGENSNNTPVENNEKDDILGRSGAAIYRAPDDTASSKESGDSIDPELTDSQGPFVFQKGEYVYTFEHPIPHFYPETMHMPHASVKYYMQLRVEKIVGHVIKTKKIMIGSRFINLYRIPPSDQVELGEPIVVDKVWNDKLKYNLIIPRKELVLNAFLPIHFEFLPLDKLIIHRIRIYLSETITYTATDKSITRIDSEKNYLLSELNGPVQEGTGSSGKKPGVKNLGNLLEDPNTGDITNKAFQFNIFVPSSFTSPKADSTSLKQVLHPDTTFEPIVCKHWLKVALRITVGPKHYEVVIDSPIHVLNPYCAHANTLLPKYDDLVSSSLPVDMTNGSDSHDSNIFYPKEIIHSPILGSETDDVTSNNENKEIRKKVFNSPTLKSNIYRPEFIKTEMTSPQALPMLSLEPDLGSKPPKYSVSNEDMPAYPPSYEQAQVPRVSVGEIPHLNLDDESINNSISSREEDITSNTFQPSIQFRVPDEESNCFLNGRLSRRASMPNSYNQKDAHYLFRRRKLSFDHVTEHSRPRNMEEILAAHAEDASDYEEALESPKVLPTDSSVDIASLLKDQHK
ncbi:Arrestin-related trafficking adapter 6 [Nakaseomyces glabratus]|uniref:Arrestin-related trafficking adapter 6 n=1 Tax=Candida glabrata TaxID=5478 RepID=A0A0W0E5I5_CANGB|nr:Arrestin (or S-antigen), C-terminal domain [Nakaseomyces glabratus]KAH7594953.1 Arrestin (or S-antigen), C-terminal domain [Nakaseomyces glabratus]KAH7611036.1 Arrestin (or S-antigen), C-terminal domain [Nakaseomyces glabratus]KTB01181.1 Arrestin-related trafficking adapter 6 [Nakaseomyces glabratus]KTB08561.1 Arrestin-related trafficking adapter 6 [Nakaseomyces glabratus]